MLLSSSNLDLLGLVLMACNGGIIEVVGGGSIVVIKLRLVKIGVVFILEVSW